MKHKKVFGYVFLAVLFMIFLSSCTIVQVELGEPNIVVQEFIKGQATDNRRLVNAVLTNDLKKRFKEQKLYLYERKDIPIGNLTKSDSLLAWDEPNKKVYQIRYSVEYEIDGETKTLSLNEALSLINKDENWYIDDYVPDKN